MDEIELTRRQVKGDRARELLESDTLKEAFSALSEQYIAAWQQSAARDTDARERLWQAVNVVALVQDHLKKQVTNGRIAKADLERLEAQRKAASKR